MGFKAREVLPLPTRDGILQSLTPEDIFSYYLEGLPRRPINSPLRDDKHASFSLFHSDKYNQLFYKDFATGETGDCFHFVRKLCRITTLNDAFNRIALDFQLSQFEINGVAIKRTNTSMVRVRKEKKVAKRAEIKIKTREWCIRDACFWYHKYGIELKLARKNDIHPISHFFVNGQTYVADKLAYAFVERKDGKLTYKIYQPESKVKKWINNNDFSTWELWAQLPLTGETCIITSSRKDALVIKSIFRDNFITSCSLQSETVMPKKSVIDELKTRFKYVYVLYDNDYLNPNNPGRAAGKKLSDMFGLTQIELPWEMYKCKDISDFREIWNKHNTRNIILNLIKDTK